MGGGGGDGRVAEGFGEAVGILDAIFFEDEAIFGDGDGGGVGGIVDEVMEFVGILGEIVEFPGVDVVEEDEFFGGGADAVVGLDAVIAWVMVVSVIHGGAPIGWGFATEERGEASALHLRGDGEACEVEESGGEVDIEDHLGDDGIWFGDAWGGDEERDAEGRIVHEAFIEPVMVAEVEAVIAGINNHGIFEEIVIFKVIEEAPDIIVHGGDAAEVIFDKALIFPEFESGAGEVGGWRAFGIGGIEMEIDAHGGFGGGGGAGGIIVVESGRGGDIDIVVEMGVFGVGLPVSVGGFGVGEEEEGAIFGAIFEESD